jgi:hypothetical protein
MLTKAKTTGRTLERVRIVKRKQKRQPRKLLESVQQDWDRWEKAAQLEGLNWSEFTRRALNERTDRVLEAAKKPKRKAS